jgi:hypothetical protein
MHNVGVQMQLHVFVICDFAQHSECNGTLSGNLVQCCGSCGRPPDFTSLHNLDLPLLSHYLQFVKLADLSLAFPYLLFPSSALFHFPDLPQALYISVPIPQLVSSWLAMTSPNPLITHIIQSLLPQTYCPLMTLKMESVSSSETLVTNY